MKDNIKIITFTNFRGAGKSSIARLLAEITNSSILNFDTKRDAEHYNVVNTINIKEDKSISRTKNSIILEDAEERQEIKSKSNILICDLGGYFDERLIPIQSDYYVIPSYDDYESIRETMRTANYIISKIPQAKLIFVLNGVLIPDSKMKKEKLEEFNENLKINGLDKFPTLFLGYTKLMRKLVDEAIKRKDIKNKDGLDVRYPKVDKFINKLLDNLKIKV